MKIAKGELPENINKESIKAVFLNFGQVKKILKKEVNSKVYFYDEIDEKDANIENEKDTLERILGNNFINPGIGLLVIYNKKNVGDRLDWIASGSKNDVIDNMIGLPKLKEKYKLKGYVSFTIDLSEMKKPDLEIPILEFNRVLSS